MYEISNKFLSSYECFVFQVILQIIVLKTELENLTALKRDDPEIISLQYKSIRENLQVC